MSYQYPSLESSTPATERHTSLGASIAIKAGLLLTAAIIADQAAVTTQRQRSLDAALIEVHKTPDADRLIFTQFGVNTNSRNEGVQFHRQLGHLGSVANTIWHNTKIPHERLMCDMVQVRRDSTEPLTTMVVHSFGGYDLAVMASNAAFRREMEPVDLVVFDSSFASPGAIAPKGRRMLSAAERTPFRWTISHAPRVFSPLELIGEQSRFIQQHLPAPGSMEGFAGKVVCIQSPNDPWIVNELAYESIQRVCGDQEVELILDDSRPGHSGMHHYPQVLERVVSGREWQDVGIDTRVVA